MIKHKGETAMETQLEAIFKIDPEATKYIETEVIPKRDPVFIARLLPKGLNVLDLFNWKGTPQGRGYWLKIWMALNENNNGCLPKIT